MRSAMAAMTEHNPAEDQQSGLEAPLKLHDTELGDCLQDLIVAIFRMAVTDYFGERYYLDEPEEPYEIVEMRRLDAERFLSSPYAEDLAKLIGLPRGAVKRSLQRSRRSARARARQDDSWDL